MLTTFKGQDPSLAGSSECEFLIGSINAFKNDSKEDFEHIYSQYKQTNSGSYDSWNKEILNKIYHKIQGGKTIEPNKNNNENHKEEKPDDYLGNDDK